MALSNVELYEALRGSVGEDAARLIAEVVPAAEQLATKQDIAELHTAIQRSSKETMRWMLTFFVPVWLGTWGTILAIVLKR